VKREDAPYVLLTLEIKVTNENATADNVQETGLKEVHNPTYYEKLDVL
jgi:hypothetical protein